MYIVLLMLMLDVLKCQFMGERRMVFGGGEDSMFKAK